MAIEWVYWWTEIKPVLGPLVQAAVVLVVGAFTVWFQLKQARTAERKLFADIHDKRYQAISSFTRDITELVLDTLAENDADHQPPGSIVSSHQRSRTLFAQMQELTWLFGNDVMLPVTKMHGHAEQILATINRIRHQLKSDNPVTLVEDINWHNDNMYLALGQINEASRHYLYVGHIKMKAPRMPAFTTKELSIKPRGV